MKCKVTMNERGVITIPAALRQAFALKPNDELILVETNHGILVQPAISVPIEMYTDERIKEFTADEPEIKKLLPKISRSAVKR